MPAPQVPPSTPYQVAVECNGDGDIRGYASPERVLEDQPEGTPAPESVGEAMGGGGLLTVTRGRPGEGAPVRVSEPAHVPH